MNQAKPEMLEATEEQKAEARIAAANAARELAREKQYTQRFEGKDVQYETVRGVTMPIEPGASPLRREIERKKALKRMKGDDRALGRLQRAIEATKQ